MSTKNFLFHRVTQRQRHSDNTIGVTSVESLHAKQNERCPLFRCNNLYKKRRSLSLVTLIVTCDAHCHVRCHQYQYVTFYVKWQVLRSLSCVTPLVPCDVHWQVLSTLSCVTLLLQYCDVHRQVLHSLFRVTILIARDTLRHR
jgi:hypothetical protein